MEGAINDAAAKKNAESADHLSSLIFEKEPISTTFGQQAIEPKTGSFQLPKIDFVISHGQEEASYFGDGKVVVQKTDKKVNPECSNGVRSADGSEQRFDNTGLCKVSGDVHWGKSVDGVMQIDIGGNVKIGLDKNWHLVNVQGEHNSYKVGDEIKHPLEAPPQSAQVAEHAAHAAAGAQTQAADHHAELAGKGKAEPAESHKAVALKAEAHKPEIHKKVASHHGVEAALKKATSPAAAAKTDFDLNGIY